MRSLVVRPNRIAHEIDNLFSGFLNHPAQYAAGDCDYAPRVDIVETEDNIAMKFEVPGWDKSDLKINVKDKVLTVGGEQKVENEEKNENYIRSEIRTGSFCRSFTLPDTVDSGKIKADYKNGILELTLGKREEVKPKEIEVKVS